MVTLAPGQLGWRMTGFRNTMSACHSLGDAPATIRSLAQSAKEGPRRDQAESPLPRTGGWNQAKAFCPAQWVRFKSTAHSTV
jgi:hypothetical protein